MPITLPRSNGFESDAQRPRRRLRLGGAQHRANNRHASRAGSHDRRRIARRNAADTDHGHTFRRQARQRRETLWAQRRTGVGLRGCGEAGPDTPIIGRGRGARRLVRRPDGKTQQKAGGQTGAEGVERRIVPAEVRPGSSGGQGDVHAVVDEHGHRQRGDQRPGQLQNLGRRAIFPPHLHHRGATGYRGAADGHRIPPLEQNGIRDHHQAQLIGKSHDQDPARPAWSDHGDRQHQ